MRLKTQIESEEEIEFDLIKRGLLKKSTKSNHYVSNKELLAAYREYYKIKVQHDEMGLDAPPLPEKIGAAIIQIATRRTNSWEVTRHATESWKEEFIGNAIITAAIRGVGFDPNKSENPFAYLTQIVNNALLEQLKKERKQLYIRYKSIEEANNFLGELDENIEDYDVSGTDLSDEFTNERRRFINEYEKRHLTRDKDDTEEEVENEGLDL